MVTFRSQGSPFLSPSLTAAEPRQRERALALFKTRMRGQRDDLLSARVMVRDTVRFRFINLLLLSSPRPQKRVSASGRSHSSRRALVKPISRLQWNGGFGADFGPFRGDPCRPALRPIEASKAAVCYVRNTSTPAVSYAQIAVVPDSVKLRTGSLSLRTERSAVGLKAMNFANRFRKA
jgi:hypothetical protein